MELQTDKCSWKVKQNLDIVIKLDKTPVPSGGQLPPKFAKFGQNSNFSSSDKKIFEQNQNFPGSDIKIWAKSGILGQRQ